MPLNDISTPGTGGPKPRKYLTLSVAGDDRSVKYRETNDGSSPSYVFAQDRTASTRTFYSPWPDNQDQFDAFIKDWLGFPKADYQGGKWYLSRTIPATQPSRPYLYAEQIPQYEPSGPLQRSVVGGVPDPADEEADDEEEEEDGVEEEVTYVDANGVGVWPECKYTVTYTQRRYKILTDSDLSYYTGTPADESSLLRYVSFEFQPGGYYQTLPTTSSLRWVDGTPATGSPPVGGTPAVLKQAILLSQADLLITWHQVPLDAIPHNAIDDTVGHTNLNAMGGSIYTNGRVRSIVPFIDFGTAVLLWPRMKQVMWPTGDILCDIIYPLKIYPNGANSFYRFNTPTGQSPGFQPVTFNGLATGQQLFPPVDFSDLFRPEG